VNSVNDQHGGEDVETDIHKQQSQQRKVRDTWHIGQPQGEQPQAQDESKRVSVSVKSNTA